MVPVAPVVRLARLARLARLSANRGWSGYGRPVPDTAVPTLDERRGPGPWPAAEDGDPRGRVYRARAYHRRRDGAKIAGASVLTVALLAVGLSQHPGSAPTVVSDVGVSPIAAGAFAPDACVAYAPLSGPSRGTVVLDPAGDSADPGAVGRSDSGAQVPEARATLPAVLDAVPLLRRAGYRVVVSRLTSRALVPGVVSAAADARAQIRCADAAHAGVLVALDYGAAATLTATGALAAWDPARPFAGRNERLAALLLSSVRSALARAGQAAPRIGVVRDTPVQAPELTGLASARGHLLLLGPAPGRLSVMPGAVVMPLLLSNPYEASLAMTPAVQEAVGAGIARGVERFLRQVSGPKTASG